MNVRSTIALSSLTLWTACAAPSAKSGGDRPYLLERVDDVAIVQVYADGFEELERRDRVLCWHLYQAAVAGREIYVQQRSAFGLDLMQLGEEMLVHSGGIDAAFEAELRRYMKLFWVNHSPYNNVTARKNCLRSTPSELLAAAETARRNGARLPLREGETVRGMVARLSPILFDPEFEEMVTVKSPRAGEDAVEASAATFYGPGVTSRRLEGFEERYALNSNVELGDGGELVERPWRAGDAERGIPPGIYADSIERIVRHLEAALPFANDATRRALEAQIRFYRSGEREDRVAYDVAWVADKDSVVDTVNSFVEVYVDPRGVKGAWEGIVSFENPVAAASIRKLAAHAQWFEDHMPYAPEFRKREVRGISARSIDVVIETGDAGPVTAIGINLPNDAKVREQHGSKSVSLANIVDAYARSTPPGELREFCFDDAEARRAEKWKARTGSLLVDMHEVIGHASGRMADGVTEEPAASLREHYSALEEARSDLVALYFMADPELAELGLLDDPREAALACYEQYARNGGLQQLRRVAHGEQIEEDHMRNRQMIVRWILANRPEALASVQRDGKTFLRVLDVDEFRAACGALLAEVQRIKSTGDFEGASRLFDEFGVRFDPALRDEVVRRYASLDVPAYVGFLFPRLVALRDAAGTVVDARIEYPSSIEEQMLEWSGRLRR